MPSIQPPPRIQAPNIAPYQPPPPFGYTPKQPGAFTLDAPRPQAVGSFTGTAPQPASVASFTGQAPTAKPTAAFVAPQPGGFSPAGQFRLNASLKALQAGAAARGSLLTGPLQARLIEHAGEAASQEYDKDFDRAAQTYTLNRGTDAQNFGQQVTGFEAGRSIYDTNRATSALNTGQQRDAYHDLLTGYETNRDTAAMNATQDRATFDDALSGFKANADTTLASNAQGLQAATAGYDRNTAAGRTVYEDAAADTMRRTGVENVNNAGAYQTQMFEYARQAEEAQRAQQLELQRQAQAQADAERQRQEMERRRLENERIQAAGSARQNAATNAVPPAPISAPVSYLPYEQTGATRRRR